MRIGRLATVLVLAAGTFALFLAYTFKSLSALSSSMAALVRPALWAGTATTLLGLLLNATIFRERPATRGPNSGPGFRPVPRSAARRFLAAVVAGFVLGWVSFGAFIYLVQDQLVFSPRGLSASRLEQIRRDYPRAEDIEIVAGDGTVLRGWLLPPVTWAQPTESPTRAPLVLVFTGQGGEASRYFELARWLPELAWAFVNYRGYGASDGSPSDVALFDDATMVFDSLTSRPDIDPDQVVALGGSLGTGVATYLAAHRPLAAVVLFSPYDSIGAGVARDFLPFLPTGVLFRHRFDAAAHAPSATAPVLAIVGENDLVIRPARSMELLRRWGGPHQLILVPGGDHLSIYEDDEVWHAIQRFVRGNLN